MQCVTGSSHIVNSLSVSGNYGQRRFIFHTKSEGICGRQLSDGQLKVRSLSLSMTCSLALRLRRRQGTLLLRSLSPRHASRDRSCSSRASKSASVQRKMFTRAPVETWSRHQAREREDARQAHTSVSRCASCAAIARLRRSPPPPPVPLRPSRSSTVLCACMY